MKETSETTKIPCAVCRDLMPLVQDGVASPESEALVQAHLAACPACRALWQGTEPEATPEPPAPDDGKIIQRLRRRYSTHLLLLALAGIAAGIALGYTGRSNWVILFLPLVWGGLVVLDTIVKQLAFLESFSIGNFLFNLASGCILYVALGGMGWLIGWLLHYVKEESANDKDQKDPKNHA